MDLDGLHTDDIQYLLHELQVHQAELAIQNEELRRVQVDLEVSRDLFSDLYNFAPAGYCTLSQKGRILNANQSLADLLEVGHEKLLHRPLSDFVDSADQDEYYLHCQRALKDHRRAVSEIRLVKPAGERIMVRIESVTARNDPTQLMVMLSDITGQRQLEEKQQEYAAQIVLQRRLMEQSEKERGELARNLHDGPLQSLTGLGFSLQILKEDLKDHVGAKETRILSRWERISRIWPQSCAASVMTSARRCLPGLACAGRSKNMPRNFRRNTRTPRSSWSFRMTQGGCPNPFRSRSTGSINRQ